MKNLLLGALMLCAPAAFAQGAAAESPAEAKTDAPAEPPPPDVSKLPFTPDSIRQVMSYHQPKIQGCYEELLAAKEKTVEGKLMTSFTITAEGLVSKPKVVKKKTSIRDPKFHDCVVAVLTSMEFPKPKDGRPQPIEYPFNLKAVE